MMITKRNVLRYWEWSKAGRNWSVLYPWKKKTTWDKIHIHLAFFLRAFSGLHGPDSLIVKQNTAVSLAKGVWRFQWYQNGYKLMEKIQESKNLCKRKHQNLNINTSQIFGQLQNRTCEELKQKSTVEGNMPKVIFQLLLTSEETELAGLTMPC